MGIPDAIWANVESVLANSPNELAALRRLRIADAARVDGAQLEAVRDLLDTVSEKANPALRIAVLHHHLLPVSAKEEVKTFESLSNLGLVRQFLREQQISVVLHGHKHAEFTYMDYVSSYSGQSGNPWPVRVISGASGSGDDVLRDDICRLIEVDVDLNSLAVERVGAVLPGAALIAGPSQRLDFRMPRSAEMIQTDGCLLVEGRSVAAVYRQLLARLGGLSKETEHVICRILEAPEIEDIAALYPGLESSVSEGEDRTTSAVASVEEFGRIAAANL